MSQQQGKAPKGGRKLKRISKYKNHYARNFGNVERNKKRRMERHAFMVAQSQEKRDGLSVRAFKKVVMRMGLSVMERKAYLKAHGA